VANRSLEVVSEAVPVLEGANDDAGLARAARLEMYSQVMLGRFTDATASSVRIVDHARRAGDERLVSRSVAAIANILVHGPAHVDGATAQTRELLAGVHGDRKVEAILLGALAQLQAMAEEFEGARESYHREQEILAELGSGIDASSTSIDSGRVELLAGDAEAAERELRRDYDALEALGEAYLRSTVAAMLGEALWQLGRLDEADEFAGIAASLADEDDVVSQVGWRSTRAKVFAARGNTTEAIELAEEGVAAAAATEEVGLHADALIALSFVRSRAGQEK
jgi:tetratricopeptide (TPR) repeat protein